MIDEDRYCVDISNQLLATEALLKKNNNEIMHAHIRGCVSEGLQTDEPNKKLEEALSLLDKLLYALPFYIFLQRLTYAFKYSKIVLMED